MEELEILKQLGTTILGIILTILTFIFKGHKSQKSKKRLLIIGEIASRLNEWIKEAESFKNYTGLEKKEYVLTKASRYALENKFDFYEEDIKEKLEELIDFSKSVNVSQKEESIFGRRQ